MTDEQATALAEAIADLARDIAWQVHGSDDTPAGRNDEPALKAKLAALIKGLPQRFDGPRPGNHVHQRADVAEACLRCNPRKTP